MDEKKDTGYLLKELSQGFIETRLYLIEYAINHTLDDFLTRALDEVGALVNSPVGFYHFMDPETNTPYMQQWSTRTRNEFCRTEVKEIHYSLEKAGVWADCVNKKKSVVHNDFVSHSHQKGIPAGHAGIIRELVIPVIRGDKVVAILGVGNKPTEYSQRDVEVVSYLADVTWEIVQHKKAEETILKEKKQARKYLDIAGVMFCALNSKGEITLINQKGCEILRVSEPEALGQNWFDRYIPIWMVEEQKSVFHKLMAGESEPVEYCENPVLTSKGEERIIAFHNTLLADETGKIQGILFSGQDITERKMSDNAFQAILQSTVGKTGQDFFNNICFQLCRLFKSDCAMVGELSDSSTVNTISMLHGEDYIRDCSYQLNGTPCNQVLNKGFCYYPEDVSRRFPLVRALQEMKAEGYAGISLKDHTGRAIGVLCIISKQKIILPEYAEDLMKIISARASAEIERMKSEREKEKLEKYLQQSQKMEAIGTLAGGIAHDFNNILSAILGYADMARVDAPAGSTIANDLEKVLAAGSRAKDLVKQILTFCRQTDSECVPQQPASIVKETIKMLRPSLPSTIEINHNIASKTGLICAGPFQIQQILMNLCTNAFHAMEKTGGKLDISLTETEISSEDIPYETNVENSKYIQLSVCDTGSGISPETKDKIFDPYFTTKEIGKGTGMGLSIVHGIVKSYGGFITVQSELGKGSAFHVFLPVIMQELQPKIEAVEQVPIGKERILYVDDEEFLSGLGKTMLERLGYQVTVQSSSYKALEMFQNQPDQFDLIITDQTMPGMTGADLAKKIIQIKPDFPIILCTGYSSIISENKAKSIGIKEFALKPLMQNDLARIIRKALDAS